MNLLAYYSPDFFTSDQAPICADGNTGETLRTGAIRWNQAIGFTGVDDLLSQLGQHEDVQTLGILCHGEPGGLRMLSNNHVLRQLGTHGTRFREMGEHLQRSGSGRAQRPTVIFLACSAAAEPQGTDLFRNLSSWMPTTLLVAFTRLLRINGVTPRDLGEGRVCLPPDVQVTDDEYDHSQSIASQATSTEDAREGWTEASTRSMYAVRFLNGSRLGSRRRRASLMPPNESFRPTTSHFGRSSPERAPGVRVG